jgi:hypothetical protein
MHEMNFQQTFSTVFFAVAIYSRGGRVYSVDERGHTLNNLCDFLPSNVKVN